MAHLAELEISCWVVLNPNALQGLICALSDEKKQPAESLTQFRNFNFTHPKNLRSKITRNTLESQSYLFSF